MSAAAQVRRNPDEAPANQTEFYRHYFGYVKRFVVKYGGIKPQDAEDVANSIWCNLLRRDVLSQFDPDKLIVHDGKQYKARFERYLARMLDLYVRHYRAQQSRRSAHEVYVDTDADGDLFELLLGGTDDSAYYDELDEAELVGQLVSYLRQVPWRQSDPDFERLFLCVVEHARYYGKIKVRELAGVLKVEEKVLKSWLAMLRGHLADALSGREPDSAPVLAPREARFNFGGVVVGLPELEAARDALRACRSNMIKQPLAAIKSPLAVCDYHAVAEEFRAHTHFVASLTRHAEKEAFFGALIEAISVYASA